MNKHISKNDHIKDPTFSELVKKVMSEKNNKKGKAFKTVPYHMRPSVVSMDAIKGSLGK